MALLLTAAAALSVLVDIDATLQPEVAAENVLELRWRCFESHFALALTDALAHNYSGLAAIVQLSIKNVAL